MALGAVAVGDDSQGRFGSVDRSNGVAPTESFGAAVGGRAHVDDRDVKVADVPDELDRLLVTCGVLDIEVLSKKIANPQAHDRMVVDDKAAWSCGQTQSSDPLGLQTCRSPSG